MHPMGAVPLDQRSDKWLDHRMSTYLTFIGCMNAAGAVILLACLNEDFADRLLRRWFYIVPQDTPYKHSAYGPIWLWWATIGSLLIMRFLDFGITGLIVFIIVHWLGDLVWHSFVSVLVYRTKSLWGEKFQEWLFIACALLLAGFGIWFMVSGIQSVV